MTNYKKQKKLKANDEFHKYQKIKKIIASQALPIVIGASSVFIICLFGIIPGFTFSTLFKIDVVLSVGLVTIITWGVTLFEKLINRQIEEKIKLNGNYKEQIDRYKKENIYVSASGKKYPLVEICPQINSVTATISEIATYQLDPIIVKYMTELMNAHKTSRFKNKTIYRLDTYEYDGSNLSINISRSDDYYTLLTNRVMDFELHDHITVREVFEPGPKLHSFENSKLCNGFGFNFIVQTRDGFYSMVKKTNKNPTNKFKYSHFSSSLDTHFNDNDKEYIGRLKQLTYNALITNFNYVKNDDNQFLYQTVEEKDIEYIGLFRNLIEGGKPELCYIVHLDKSKDELIQQFEAASKDTKKDRGVDKIVTFKKEDYKILEQDKVRFKDLDEDATVPLVGMYILKKIKNG